VQLTHLEDVDIQVQVVVVVVEQGFLGLGGFGAVVEQALEPLHPMQLPVQLILLEDYYTPDHSKQQVAQGQQKGLHYY